MSLNRTYFLAVWNEKIDAKQRNAILIPRVSHFLNLERNKSLRLRHRTFRYVMEAAKGHRLRVPEDIAVVGFDDIPAAKRQMIFINRGLAVWTSVVSIPIVIYNREFLRKILPESMMIKSVRIIDIE
jgi:hypothetical protein